MDEEVALATPVERMSDWMRGEEPAPYPLAEGAQDQRIALTIEETADTDTTVTTPAGGLGVSADAKLTRKAHSCG